ncbi:hypothetical protein GOP47_0001750 [Adiantum capillus-veneris]|uniref:Uncharacterized protein n=1 Tax=Adiantum capillus-veneris TaxID=13818 RepID=A0A9D4V9F0_ADICA|nr:hypothetical protein GOP47_0001750 [Adiantum capillus-veneris]
MGEAQALLRRSHCHNVTKGTSFFLGSPFGWDLLCTSRRNSDYLISNKLGLLLLRRPKHKPPKNIASDKTTCLRFWWATPCGNCASGRAQSPPLPLYLA